MSGFYPVIVVTAKVKLKDEFTGCSYELSALEGSEPWYRRIGYTALSGTAQSTGHLHCSPVTINGYLYEVWTLPHFGTVFTFEP